MKKICLFLICLFLFIPIISANDNATTKESNSIDTTTTSNCNGSNCITNEECESEDCITEDDQTNSEEDNDDGLLNDGKSVILIEASTGKVLYEKNAHDRYAPASMTKIMSMILIMEEIEKGNLKWNDTLVASEYAASMGGSQIFLQANEKMSVKDLFKAVAIGSANDVAVTKKQSLVISEEIII